MIPVAITAKVLTYNILNRVTAAVWIDWAYEMLLAGFETDHLLILAGMGQQREYFEMRTFLYFAKEDLLHGEVQWYI